MHIGKVKLAPYIDIALGDRAARSTGARPESLGGSALGTDTMYSMLLGLDGKSCTGTGRKRAITDIAVSRGTCKYRMATFNHCKYIYLLISDTYKELCSTQKSVRKCAVVCHLHSRQRAAIGRCPRRDPYFHNRGLTKRDRTGPIQLPKGNRLLLSHLGVSRDLLVAVIFQRRVGDLDQYCRSPSFPPSFAPLRLRAFA